MLIHVNTCCVETWFYRNVALIAWTSYHISHTEMMACLSGKKLVGFCWGLCEIVRNNFSFQSAAIKWEPGFAYFCWTGKNYLLSGIGHDRHKNGNRKTHISSRKAMEQLLIRRFSKNVPKGCILPFSSSRSSFCYCESVIYLVCLVCDRK